MNHKPNAFLKAGLAAVGLCALASTASAAGLFTYDDANLFLTFRKVAPFTESYEVVVDAGQASNYVFAAIGTTNTVAAYSTSQLLGSFNSYNNLTWAAVGATLYTPPGYIDYPPTTLWLTVPRADNTVRSPDAQRHSLMEQYNDYAAIINIPANASFISASIGTAGTYNSATFVRESIATYPSQILTRWIGGSVDPTVGTLNDNWIDNNLENTTGDAFDGSGDVVRSDLYEIRPMDDGNGGTFVDPHTGTTGLAYYVGYFELRSDGSMVFVRESASTIAPAPAISSVSPSPVTGSSFPQALAITGNNFVSGCSVLLTNTDTLAASSPVVTFTSSSSLTVSNVFGLVAHNWTVTVVNPDTTPSTPFAFAVTAPGQPSLGKPTFNAGHTQLTLSGTNGTAGLSYLVLGCTNVSVSLAQWTRLQTNSFNPDRSFSATLNVDPSQAKYFYIIEP